MDTLLQPAEDHRNKAAQELAQALNDIQLFLEKWGRVIILSPEEFLDLRALCQAFSIADEDKVTSAVLKVAPHGSIEWSHGRHVVIELGSS